LKMNDANDHMTVGGACYIQSYYGEGGSYNDLTDGLLELKGDFYQITKDNASSSNFNAYGNHRVTFTGEGIQTVHFDSSNSGFNILTASTNTKIDFTNARISSLDSAVTVTNFIQCGDMTLNGQKLTILDNMIQQGNIYGDGGTLLVKGNYTQVSGTLDLNNADVTIDGDYRLQSIQNNDNGSTSYSTTYGVLKMNDANDHLTIGVPAIFRAITVKAAVIITLLTVCSNSKAISIRSPQKMPAAAISMPVKIIVLPSAVTVYRRCILTAAAPASIS